MLFFSVKPIQLFQKEASRKRGFFSTVTFVLNPLHVASDVHIYAAVQELVSEIGGRKGG